MESIAQVSNMLVGSYGISGLLLMTLLILLFVFQMYYYLGVYARLPKYRNGDRIPRSGFAPGVSVVVLLEDDMWYLENTLPVLLTQEYEQYEIMIVEIGTTEEFSEELAAIKKRYPHLNTTKIEYDPRFPISDKIAYNVGIKGASFDNVILTTSVSKPVSSKWLSCMAKGFANGEVVLGYCGIEEKPGFSNKMMRVVRLMNSVRWLSSAVEKKPYRGIIHNIGFTKDIYFRHRGFDYLNMNLGVDDLFIQRIADDRNTSVVMNPHATVRQHQSAGRDWWYEQRKFHLASYPYYKLYAQVNTVFEEIIRFLFYALSVLLIVIMPFEIKIAVAALWLLRMFVVRYKMWKVRRRLGELGVGNMLMLYDLISPFTRLWVGIVSRLRPASGVWR